MIRIKGFASLPPLANNTPNVINPIGELSAFSETFASDRKIFKDADQYPNGLLYVFSSLRELSSTSYEPVNPPTAIVALTLRIMEDLFNLSVSGQLTADREALMEYLLGNYEGAIQNVDFGEIISDGRQWMPSDLYFEGTSLEAPYSVRLWFADGAFRRQYDLFEHRPISPIENLDDFFGLYAEVTELVKGITPAKIAVNADLVANKQPYTMLIVEEFDWVDPTNKARRIPVPWPVLDYGEAGKNLDALKNTLKEYILANSQYDEDAWNAIFPDIFGATEVIFVPNWPHWAIPVDTLNSGVYSAAGNWKALRDLAHQLVRGNDYTEEHIDNVLNIVASSYKCVQMAVVGGPRNRDGINQFADLWPDYLAVSTSSIDFDRMSDSTKQFARILNTLLLTAETMTSQTDIPSGTLRVIRDNVLYITASFNRIQLLVASAYSVTEKIPPYTGSTPEASEGV